MNHLEAKISKSKMHKILSRLNGSLKNDESISYILDSTLDSRFYSLTNISFILIPTKELDLQYMYIFVIRDMRTKLENAF